MEHMLISLLCSGLIYTKDYHKACLNGAQATSIVTGARAKIKQSEKMAKKIVEKQVNEGALTVAGLAYGLQTKGALIYTFKKVGPINSVSILANDKQFNLTLGFTFK
jgi:hypothetical protein